MGDTTEPVKRNPVQYAEDVLDVHGPWQEAMSRLNHHADVSEKVIMCKGEIRALKARIEDRTFEIRSDAPSTPGFPSSGITAQKDFTKLLVEGDATIKDLESRLANCQSSLEIAQSQVSHHELGLGVLTARMAELGGLLHFYASAKESETAQRAHVNTSTQAHKEQDA